jgi:tryptophan synthase alpha chain
MNRVSEKLSQLRQRGKKALSLFVTAGFPELDSTVPIILELERAGADLIELGIPWSDPLADGPILQACSERSLRNGTSVKGVFRMVENLRKHSQIPIVLMGYANPVFSYGMERFLTQCSASGADGTIIADLPLEESGEYMRTAERLGIATIFLAAPTTSDSRLQELDSASRGFLYCVSITGVTGERTGIAAQAEEFLGRARRLTRKNSLLVGFGITTAEDARSIAQLADGVIIGSALMKTIGAASPEEAHLKAGEFARAFRQALDHTEEECRVRA